ncbi:MULTISPECIES: MbtH family protein [Actinomycetes]|uniref:MbtH family NRPS accessory protein n=2 Tax=Actinomycetes TaxID=1760 RepID=A0ABP8SY65_9ACTN|nr:MULTISPECIES: MbtH family NRPS accessory protein [unclassified Streptomyces]MCE3032297.1 MbtH family NRPS accessory protein [Streptomyces sp. CMSTAAHL-2]TGZ17561.1 MbtH protein [Streptomyces sp. S816]
MSTAVTIWAVVVNDEEQRSVWPADSEPPAGWRTLGFTGSREECLTRIAAEWTDLRPASLRRRMSAA